MKSEHAQVALNSAIDKMKGETKKPDIPNDHPIQDMMKMSHVGPYKSPMGSGIVVSAAGEYGNSGDVEHHHFLTHGSDGKPFDVPKHFVMRESKPEKSVPVATKK